MKRQFLMACVLMLSTGHIKTKSFIDALSTTPSGREAVFGVGLFFVAGLAKQYWWDNIHEGQHRSFNPVVSEDRAAHKNKGKRVVGGVQVGGTSVTAKIPYEGSFQDMLDKLAPYAAVGIRPKYDKSVSVEEREAVGRQRSAYIEIGLGPSCKVEVRESVSNGLVGIIAAGFAWVIKAGIQAQQK